jgi:poly(A) polymerase
LLIRYGINESGKRFERARIYTVDEHGISRQKIDSEALLITDRLQKEGYHAYIVGGAVRDLLIGNLPKDFDITTDAQPKKVRRLFWNSRIIGRRFRLVHVHFKKQIIEVSTFRSNEPGADNNDFGTLEGDVERRDFSINALYYDPRKEHVLDFVGAMKDIRIRRMRSLLPLESTFLEDPVRMLRAVKYAAAGGFRIPFSLKNSIRRYRTELEKTPTSRMTEEVFKIFTGSKSEPILALAEQYGLLEYMLPSLRQTLQRKFGRRWIREFQPVLASLDETAAAAEGEGLERGEVIKRVFGSCLEIPEEEDFDLKFKGAFRGMKELLSPLTPPNADIDRAVQLLFDELGIVKEKKKKKKRRRRRKLKKAPDTGPQAAEGEGAEPSQAPSEGSSPSDVSVSSSVSSGRASSGSGSASGSS